MKRHRYRIGIIGAGVIADVVHIPGILKSPDLSLAAICDINPDRLRMIGEKYGIPPGHRFISADELLACGDIDAVDICTPNDVHTALAMKAVDAGLPYSVEKPVGMETGEVASLARATMQKKLANMVCFSYRFKAAARFARDLIQNGDLGKLYHVYAQYFQSWGLPAYKTPFLWRFDKKRTGSGALGDLGSHGLDLIRFVTGSEFTGIISHNGTFITNRPYPDSDRLGTVDVDDFSHSMGEMTGGLTVNLQITRFGYSRGNYQRMEIYGSKGALVYKLDEEPGVDSLEVCLGDTMRLHNNMLKLEIPQRYYADQMQSFADILRGQGDGLAATIDDGLVNQRILDAILHSSAERSWQTI